MLRSFAWLTDDTVDLHKMIRNKKNGTPQGQKKKEIGWSKIMIDLSATNSCEHMVLISGGIIHCRCPVLLVVKLSTSTKHLQ